jgi:ACR3 family arsenite transporter
MIITALLITLVLLFSFKGEVILANPLTILWIATPLFLQTVMIFWLGYGVARLLRFTYEWTRSTLFGIFPCTKFLR